MMRGEIWMVDLGMAAKPRPAVILSVPFDDDEKAVVTCVARTTQQRGGRFEVAHPAPHFLPGVIDAQSLGTVPVVQWSMSISAQVDPLPEHTRTSRKFPAKSEVARSAQRRRSIRQVTASTSEDRAGEIVISLSYLVLATHSVVQL